VRYAIEERTLLKTLDITILRTIQGY